MMGELTIELTGRVLHSNFEGYRAKLIEMIRSTDVRVTTEEEFLRAAERVKFFKRAEQALHAAKNRAILQTVDIRPLFEAIDEIASETRSARLSLERQIRDRKIRIRNDLIDEGIRAADRSFEEMPAASFSLELRTLVRRELLRRSRFSSGVQRSHT